VVTNASDVGLGAVLMEASHIVAFLSQAVSPRNPALFTYDKEGSAIYSYGY